MASHLATKAFLSDNPEKWDNYLQKEAAKDPDSNSINGNLNEKIINLKKTSVSNKIFSDYHIRNVDFSGSKIKNCTFENCLIEHCIFITTKISNTNFINCTINWSRFQRNAFSGKVKMTETLFQSCIIQDNFEKLILTNSVFINTDLSNTSLNSADLRGVQFKTQSNLTNTTWSKTKINRLTNFTRAKFENHSITRDESQNIKFSSIFQTLLFNWKSTRALGSLPVFEISWILFLGSLFLVNSISRINNASPAIFDGFNRIPIPTDIELLIISSLLLVIGSTVYKIYCPEQIKQFTEAEWVYEHKHPRQEYLSQSLQRPLLQAISILTLLSGGLIGLYLVIVRLIDAIHYILAF